jgi:membrane protein
MMLLFDTIKTIKHWWNDDPFTQSAAAAFYAVLSMPGLLILVMGIAALFMEGARVETTVFNHLEAMMGAKVADNISNILNRTQYGDQDLKALIIGLITLMFGASGFFVQLQRSFNHIWDIKNQAIRFGMIKSRLLSLGLIIAVGVLMVISMAVTSFITLLSEWLSQNLPDFVLFAVYGLNFVLSLSVTAILFGLLYKVLPDTHVGYRNALKGGIFAAVIFKIAEYGLNFYFEAVKPHTAFGAAGSIILVMLWVYFSCMIIFIGAELSKTLQQKKKTALQ